MTLRPHGLPAVPGLALALALLALAPALGAGVADTPPPLPVVGVDPFANGTVVEKHADALVHWLERGLTGAVLLHVDAYNDMHIIAPARLAALRDLRGRADGAALTRAARAGGGPLYREETLIQAAAALGVIREVVWIMPYRFILADDAEGKIKEYLEASGFSKADVGSFRPADGCFRGTVGLVPVTICAQERLPRIAEPVLLSIDADYLLHAAADRGISPLSELRALFMALREARYPALDVVVDYSVLSGDVPPHLRWVGDVAVQILQEPHLALESVPPERWGTLQRLSTLRDSGEQDGMGLLGAVLAHLELQPHDPALLLLAAEAAAGHAGTERALAYAEEACRMDRGYCVGLREIGLKILQRGDLEAAMAFFASAERLLPGSEYRRFDLGVMLANAGKLEEALDAFRQEVARDGAFPAGFMAGAVQLARGEREAARRSFDAALAMLEQSPAVDIVGEAVRDAVKKAAAFYREENLLRQAERIETDPRLGGPAPGGKP